MRHSGADRRCAHKPLPTALFLISALLLFLLVQPAPCHAHSHAHSHSHAHVHKSTSHEHQHAHDSSHVCTASSKSASGTETSNCASPSSSSSHGVCRLHSPQHCAKSLARHLQHLSLPAAALASSLLTGLASLFAAVLLPFHSFLSRALLPYAAGALLADAFLHLLPDIYFQLQSSTNHVHGMPSSIQSLLLGVLAFFLLDAFVRTFSTHMHTHAHSNSRTTSAYINLFADALHNFCDGIAIGVAYTASSSRVSGALTTLLILLHELPQELGDFALLLRAKFSFRTAVLANLLCALTAVAGTAFALICENVYANATKERLQPFAAGALLYLALAGIVPDIVQDVVVGDALLDEENVHGADTGHERAQQAKKAEKEIGKDGLFKKLVAFVGRAALAVLAAAAGVATVASVELLHEH